MKKVSVGGMSESGYGLRTLERIRDEGLGDYTVLFVGPWDIDKLRSVVEFCRENDMRFVMDETFSRLRCVFREPFDGYEKGEFQAVLRSAGDAYDGTLFMCEYGGMSLYWPDTFVEGAPGIIPPTRRADEARDFMVENMRRMLEDAKERLLLPPMICIEAGGGVSKYHFQAGFDRVDLEMTYDRHTEFYYSAVKGAAIAYGKERFGVDMAMVWYGGNQHDELWFKRWRISLFHAFLRGADPIYAEHGLMDYKALGLDYDTDHPKVARFRAELAKLAEFAAANPRPEGFPLAKIAFVSGNLDSFAMGQPYVWGQRREGSSVSSGPAEHSWDIFNSLYRKRSWEFRYRCGESDFSGNPPLGQADVIPMEAPLECLRRYDCLIFLGWNTMTAEYYENLKSYVEGGGHLLCTLAHLDTRVDRDAPVALFNDGDFSDLFGVKATLNGAMNSYGIKFKKNPEGMAYRFPLWTAVCDPKYGDGEIPVADVELTTADIVADFANGFAEKWDELDERPAITANRLGRGVAFLIQTPEFPGAYGMRRLYTDLVGHFCDAHQDESLKVAAPDSVRYSVYEENGDRFAFFLNTDCDLPQHAKLFVNGGIREIVLEPTAIHVEAL
jgi:hypothetical protein